MTSSRAVRAGFGRTVGAAATAIALLAAPAVGQSSAGQSSAGLSNDALLSDPSAPAEVALRVAKVLNRLDRPWDVAFLPDRTMLVTERDRERITARLPGGAPHPRGQSRRRLASV